MSLDLVRALLTLVSFLLFIGICWWAYSGRRKARFDEAARLPFDDDDIHRATVLEEARRD